MNKKDKEQVLAKACKVWERIGPALRQLMQKDNLRPSEQLEIAIESVADRSGFEFLSEENAKDYKEFVAFLKANRAHWYD